ncbi:MAG TPA: energy transducer TonB [Bacteroidia bacterium]|nr:energy transducer TonB [Bacteroidia bacterium]
MKIIENNAGTLNEIIFENRNKSYGAYVIRSDYGNTILKSLGATVLFFALVSSVAVWLTNTVEEVKKLDIGENIIPTYDIYKVEVDVTPPQKIEAAAAIPPAASAATSAAVSTNLNDHAIEQTNNVTQTTDGVSNPTNQITDPNAIPGDGTNPHNTPETGGIIEGTASAKPEAMPDVMPSFDNMAAFLQKNLRYPAMALDANASGKVIVNFIIDEEGNVEKATILKGVGYGCDEEALRVIKLMLKWTPGIKNGKPVKATFNQAIVFRLQ